MKTANLAIVFTHIEGFGERAGRQTLEENERLLETHANLLSPLFRAFGGRIVKSIDDAFMVTFESPTQAVLAAIAVQDRVWQHNRAALPAERFELRIAINVGEVRLEADDVFGEPVNIAARVEGIAQPGEVYFTEAVYLAMNKAEAPAQEVGAFELKGIPGRVTVFKVPRAPYRVEAPATASPPGDEVPPFGNLGLSRVPEDAGRNQLGTYAAAVVDKAATVLARRRLPSGPVLLAGACATVLAIAMAVAAMGNERRLPRASAARRPRRRGGSSDASRTRVSGPTGAGG